MVPCSISEVIPPPKTIDDASPNPNPWTSELPPFYQVLHENVKVKGLKGRPYKNSIFCACIRFFEELYIFRSCEPQCMFSHSRVCLDSRDSSKLSFDAAACAMTSYSNADSIMWPPTRYLKSEGIWATSWNGEANVSKDFNRHLHF